MYSHYDTRKNHKLISLYSKCQEKSEEYPIFIGVAS